MEKKKLDKIKKTYSSLQKKYKLPDFDKVYQEFEIVDIEEDFVLKSVLSRMRKKIVNCIGIILPPIHPNDSSLHSLIESDILSKEEKHNMYKLYRKLNHLYHNSLASSFKDEKNIAESIKIIWKQWPEIKNEMANILSKLTAGWKKEAEEEKVEYYG